jgi:hypothetical protein
LILDHSLTLEAVLAGAVSANQPEFHVDYFVRDNNSPQQNIAWQPPKPSTLRGALNDTTDVTLISPTTGRYSTQGFVAEVQYLEITNKDTAAITLTIKTTDGSTDREKCKVTLQTNERIVYAKGIWQSFTSDNSLKTNAISYAEGTWTPTLTFATPGDLSITYSVRTGTYTKIGRRVFLDFHVQTSAFTHTTASGNSRIDGYPYTPTTSQISEHAVRWAGITKANYTHVYVQSGGSGNPGLFASGSGVASSAVSAADMPTGGSVLIVGSPAFNV